MTRIKLLATSFVASLMLSGLVVAIPSDDMAHTTWFCYLFPGIVHCPGR